MAHAFKERFGRFPPRSWQDDVDRQDVEVQTRRGRGSGTANGSESGARGEKEEVEAKKKRARERARKKRARERGQTQLPPTSREPRWRRSSPTARSELRAPQARQGRTPGEDLIRTSGRLLRTSPASSEETNCPSSCKGVDVVG